MAFKDKKNIKTNHSQENKVDASSPKNSKIKVQPKDQMALSGMNFIFMAISGLMIIGGFLLMLGPSSTVDHFEPDIFSTRRIVIGPLVAFLGFVAMAVAIMVTPFKKR